MSQRKVDNIRLSIIEKRKNKIILLEKNRDNIIEEIIIHKEYLVAYQKTIPIVEEKVLQ